MKCFWLQVASPCFVQRFVRTVRTWSAASGIGWTPQALGEFAWSGSSHRMGRMAERYLKIHGKSAKLPENCVKL